MHASDTGNLVCPLTNIHIKRSYNSSCLFIVELTFKIKWQVCSLSSIPNQQNPALSPGETQAEVSLEGTEWKGERPDWLPRHLQLRRRLFRLCSLQLLAHSKTQWYVYKGERFNFPASPCVLSRLLFSTLRHLKLLLCKHRAWASSAPRGWAGGNSTAQPTVKNSTEVTAERMC